MYSPYTSIKRGERLWQKLQENDLLKQEIIW